jgi:hypothetical protein
MTTKKPSRPPDSSFQLCLDARRLIRELRQARTIESDGNKPLWCKRNRPVVRTVRK